MLTLRVLPFSILLVARGDVANYPKKIDRDDGRRALRRAGRGEGLRNLLGRRSSGAAAGLRGDVHRGTARYAECRSPYAEVLRIRDGKRRDVEIARNPHARVAR